jgi:hypothetical protein
LDLSTPRRENRSRRLRIFLSIAGAIAALLALSHFLLLESCCYYPIPSGVSSGSELSRVTSPDGAFDAVLITEGYGGAVGGVDWFAYIVRKGQPAPIGPAKAFFDASDLEGGKLTWRYPHLVEIHFDRAHIESFRNVWGLHEIEDVGSAGEREYFVEIRLAPSSVDFSALTRDGGFQHGK